MKLSMAQIRIDADIARNLTKTIACMERAAEENADIIFFPELQRTPFFPQYEKRDAGAWAMTLDGPDGSLLEKADNAEQVIITDVPLEAVAGERAKHPWLTL